MNKFFIMLCLFIIILLIINYKDTKENYGALDSLYSNDGIQDKYLTGNRYNKYLDNGFTAFWMPTRNLNRVAFFPRNFDLNVDNLFVDY